MKDIDRLIDEALDAEERDLLRSIGEEPGFYAQFFGIFGGRTGWVNIVLLIVQTIGGVAGAWMAWKFFTTDDVLTAVRWGIPAATVIIMALTMKMAMWPELHINRLMREIKRLELQVARANRHA
ncbi:MAG: hypothetical protein IV086_18195 [Hyphomonadaceae bacterium]|nr:hypothetical protein [Hyphomonadaceae bacterium]